MVLPQPASHFAPTKRVKLCYNLIHAAEAVGIRDIADGEFQPTDTTLEEGIETFWKRPGGTDNSTV